MPFRRLLVLTLAFPLCALAQTTMSVADFGAQPDGIFRTDGAITAGSTLLTSPSGTFSPSDTGKYIQVVGAGNGGTTHSDGVILSGSSVLTSAAGSFAQTDVGRSMVVVGAGPGGQNLITHIAAFNSSSSVTLADPAGSAAAGGAYFYGAMTLEGTIQSVTNAGAVVLSGPAQASISNATYAYGTNYSAAFQKAVDAAGQAGGATVLVPGATSCPAGAVCGYVISATDQMTSRAPGAVKIRYDNVSLVGSDPQTNLFCRGAWGLYSNSAAFPGKSAAIRGNCLAIGDDGGPRGTAGENVSNVAIAKLHLYGMTDGNTYATQFSPVDPPLTTTGDGWDETHKAILMWWQSTFSNIVIDSVYIQDFKGENIYSGGSAITGMVIQNSTMTNFNGDGISVLAADLQVLNNTITNGSNAAIENATVAAGSAALVRQLYQGNTFSYFPREALVLNGVDNGVTTGGIQILNNTFDTIGQVNPSLGRVAILITPQSAGNLPPANVTITGNTCHDCYGFVWLSTSGHSQVRNNTIMVDHYSSGDLMVLSFAMNDVVIANNSGYLTPEAASKGRGVSSVYALNWGSSTLAWTNVLIHDNNWAFPGSLNYLFLTSGAGWSAVNAQNIVWQNETCAGCKYDFNHGLAVVSNSPTIPPFGPEVALVEYAPGPFNVTVDASKEQNGAELTIVNYGNQTVTFNPDANIALSSPLTLPVGGSVLFRYNGLVGKFVVAQRPTTISANANTTPQSALVNHAFGNALAVTVRDNASNPVEGIAVEFTAPASGATGTFANVTNTTTVLTDATGVATASLLSANATAGPFTGTARASGVATPANFSLTNLLPPVSITVQTSPAGRGFSVDSVAYTSSQTFQWTPNSSHNLSTTATQAGSAGTQFVFDHWSNSGTMSQVISVPNTATTYTANFNTQYQLMTSVSPAQGGTVTPGGWFNAGSSIQMQATASAGYAFSAFSGDLSGTANPQPVVMNAPKTVTASFVSSAAPTMLAVNICGGAVNTFIADAGFTGGHCDSFTQAVSVNGVTNPAPQAVYQTKRTGSNGAGFSYTLPPTGQPPLLAGQTYAVRLDFVDDVSTMAGQRRFNVLLNGTKVLSNFDVCAAAGGPLRAVAQQFTAIANAQGQIVVQWTAGSAGNPLANGIEITLPNAPPAGPVISNFTPASGGIGSSVTIAGSGFSQATAVTFNGTPATFMANSDGQISATVPAGAGTGPIRVTSAGGAALSSASFVVIAPPAPPVSIDVGSTVAVGTFTADSYVTGGHPDNVAHAITTNGVTNAAPAQVYQTKRTGNSNGPFSYAIPNLPAGHVYTVRLHFGDDVSTAAGQRRFNVAINKATVFSNFDIFVAAGSAYKAVVQQFTAPANADGQISISLTPSVGNPLLSGIELIPQ